ncbi:MAG: peptide-methionine (R)-S-oxide reductase MsrB [Anaerolineae bacterium]
MTDSGRGDRQPEDDLQSRDEQYWRDRLTDEQYRVLREAWTEPPFTGALLDVKDDGVFRCAGCGAPLFSSSAKYDSGSGWPSFFDALVEGGIETREDESHGMVRTEIVCAACGGHLGHLFSDGPQPTGQRYCVNSAALEFDAESQ